MRGLGIEFISVFGLPPVDFVHLAADLGCRYISSALVGRPLKSLGYPAFSLKDDIALRRQLLAAMDERSVGISLGEGMVIAPDTDVAGWAADLDVMAELGAAQINTLSFDRDQPHIRPTGGADGDGRRARHGNHHRSGARDDDR